MKLANRKFLIAFLIVSMSALACAIFPAGGEQAVQEVNEDNIAAIVDATINAERENQESPEEVLQAQPPNYLHCGFCLGEFWDVSVSPPALFEVPVEIGDFYDWAPNTGKILYADHFPDEGGGPGNKAVSNLFLLDIASGETQTVVAEDTVVNARWAENGEDFAYLLATPETYQLRVRRASDEDMLVAEDVNLIYAFRPDGDAIAFERKLNDDFGIDTSLHLYDFGTGAETKIAEMDRSGGGSIFDEMLWAPDGGGFTIPFISSTAGQGHAYVDIASGSATQILFAENLQSDESSLAYIDSLMFWHTGGTSIVGVRCGDCFPAPEFAPSQVVLFHLDVSRTAITSITVFHETESGTTVEVLSWHQPGASIWVILPGDFQRGTQASPYVIDLP